MFCKALSCAIEETADKTKKRIPPWQLLGKGKRKEERGEEREEKKERVLNTQKQKISNEKWFSDSLRSANRFRDYFGGSRGSSDVMCKSNAFFFVKFFMFLEKLKEFFCLV